MSKMQREKGKRWERDVATLFREAMPGAEIKRGWQTRSGSDAADVECPLYWLECKVGKMPNPRAALKQATEAAPKGRVPVAIVKDDRQEPFVCLSLDNFMDMVREHWAAMNR
jgi:hypothetical protein